MAASFDRVNHDILMGLVAKRVADKRVLKLIRGFLTAGVLMDGLVGPTEEGTPQGGPLSAVDAASSHCTPQMGKIRASGRGAGCRIMEPRTGQ